MTTPSERARALVWAGGLLVELAQDKRLPVDVRNSAIAIARHFPTVRDVSLAGLHSVALSLEVQSSGDIAAWSAEYPLGLLRESTHLLPRQEE
ncbi:MAG TPA: BPSL0761 family protein [Luteibacter sp.]|uniref:BPSL0761 family protein n=1 Tax=Luteibacter sp. TaxID=1886636 RepID=UPI002F42BE08